MKVNTFMEKPLSVRIVEARVRGHSSTSHHQHGSSILSKHDLEVQEYLCSSSRLSCVGVRRPILNFVLPAVVQGGYTRIGRDCKRLNDLYIAVSEN